MAQTISPELQRWIIAQTEAGCSPDALLQSMRQAGWQDEVALDALVVTLHAHLAQHPPEALAALPAEVWQQAEALAQQHTLGAEGGPAAGAVPRVTFPQPDLRGSPRELDVGDRVVPVWLHMRKPQLAVFGHFLSDDECQALIEAAQPRMARSLTVENATGGQAVNDDRTSSGMFFRRGENEVVARIDTKSRTAP